MRNDRLADAYDRLSPDEDAKDRIWGKIERKRRQKRPLPRPVFAAAAAVICLVVLGALLLGPQGNNRFVIKAYAMEAQPDGSVELREVDLMDSEAYGAAYIDNETGYMYVNIGLKATGDNIKSVEFSTATGFFAKQYIGDLSAVQTSGVPASYVNGKLSMFGTDFDVAGSTITLDRETADNYLLFWGKKTGEPGDGSGKLTFHAVATFTNGKTAETDITIDQRAGAGMAIINPSQEEKEQIQAAAAKYDQVLRSIPLDQCQVIPDSVKILRYGDTYEYNSNWGGSLSGTACFPITKEAMDNAMEYGLFDENGVFIISSNLNIQNGEPDGGDGYIAALVRNDDGTFTGTVYRAPGQLILEYWNK